jgi:hypothetical protein
MSLAGCVFRVPGRPLPMDVCSWSASLHSSNTRHGSLRGYASRRHFHCFCEAPNSDAPVAFFGGSATDSSLSGDVAQLGERGVRNAEVEGSIPFVSIRK